MTWTIRAWLLLVLLCVSPHATASEAAVRVVTHAGARFTVATLSPSSLRLFWKRPDGTRFGSFEALRDALAESGQRLVFATNAGIFEPDFTPSGLHVEDGHLLVPLNLREGRGNFYMRPNGVFFIGAKGAAVVSSNEYSAHPRKDVRLATQSGPLLVNRGALHPAFKAGSKNLHVRSGVGVASPTQVVFAISQQPVSLHAFATLFRDQLGCPDALYLDGFISRVYAPDIGLSSLEGDFAGILAVSEKASP